MSTIMVLGLFIVLVLLLVLTRSTYDDDLDMCYCYWYWQQALHMMTLVCVAPPGSCSAGIGHTPLSPEAI